MNNAIQIVACLSFSYFKEKDKKTTYIIQSSDKSDAVDGSRILITRAAIRRRGFLSRTKNVFLLDPGVPRYNNFSLPTLINQNVDLPFLV